MSSASMDMKDALDRDLFIYLQICQENGEPRYADIIACQCFRDLHYDAIKRLFDQPTRYFRNTINRGELA